jgi:hypothetical protein
MKEPVYTWDGVIATCTITDEYGNTFTGTAYVHEQDMDFASEKTGCTIATSRAAVTYLQSVKKNILKPQLAALKQLYYSMKHSKKFNPKSYENVMLQRQITMKEEDIKTVNLEIHKHKLFLKDFIDSKEICYQNIRKTRAKRQVENS